MNRRHRSAQLAGRASVQLHTLIFFSGEEGTKEEDAYVLDVETAAASEPALRVLIPRYGIEGRVVIPVDAADKDLVRDPVKHKLSYRPSGGKAKEVSIQVFQRVKVRIWVNELEDHQKELVVNLLEPRFDSDGNDENENNDSVVNSKDDHEIIEAATGNRKKRKSNSKPAATQKRSKQTKLD